MRLFKYYYSPQRREERREIPLLNKHCKTLFTTEAQGHRENYFMVKVKILTPNRKSLCVSVPLW